MTSILLVIICIIALFRAHPVGLAFALMHSCHKVIGGAFPDYAYYLSAGFFDVIIIGIIALFVAPSRTARHFIYLCMTCLLVNFYGWVIWFLYLPPATYNMAFIVLYCLAILFLLRKDSAENEKRNDVFNWHGVFPRTFSESFSVRGSLQDERKEG